MYKTFKVIILGILGLILLNSCQNTNQPTLGILEDIAELDFVWGENPQLDFINSSEGQLEVQEVEDGAHKVANLWANDPTNTSWYIPDTKYQFNRRLDYIPGLKKNYKYPLQNNYVRKLGTGRYQVLLKNFNGFGGVAHVTTTSQVPRSYSSYYTYYTIPIPYCKPYFWYPAGPHTYVYVTCWSSSGALVDSMFNLLFYKNSNPLPNHGLAYVFAHSLRHGDGVSYVPSHFYQYNSRGSKNRVKRLSTGHYEVTFPQMKRYYSSPDTSLNEEAENGIFLVTGYGYNDKRCKVRSHSYPKKGLHARVEIICHNSFGDLVNAQFVVTFMREPGTLGIPSNNNNELQSYQYTMLNPEIFDSTLYGWTDGRGKGNYDSSLTNNTNRLVTARVFEPGVYGVRIPQIKIVNNRTNVQVSAIGPNSAYCNSGPWLTSEAFKGNGTDIYVYCYDHTGSLVDSRFYLHYLSSTPQNLSIPNGPSFLSNDPYQNNEIIIR